MLLVGANIAAADVATGGAFRPARYPGEGRRQAVAGGAQAELSLCEREAAACDDDTECGDCSGLVMGRGWGETAGLSEIGSGGEDGNGEAGSSWGLYYGVGPPAKRCEKIGATVCRRFTVAAVQEDEGDWRRAESCLDNHLMQALLACRVRTAGCEADDAPCIVPEEQQRGGRLSSPAGESERSSNARPALWRLSEDLELAGGARVWPGARSAAAAAAPLTVADVRADADGLGPEWTTRYQRKLTTSSEATCDGIQSGSACCSSECGECGGSGCSDRGGGAEECCTGIITDSGTLCSDTGGAPPCIVDGEG